MMYYRTMTLDQVYNRRMKFAAHTGALVGRYLLGILGDRCGCGEDAEAMPLGSMLERQSNQVTVANMS